ncbi:hypothetical protein CCMSSC00406_0007533 [Pleurotus cornucopiae]|uniref:Uncharacterized protein n=1 Tax=Pleurotus cornucopiae TaxID=5321 RepID=A0ACB7J6S1_PLECO|nr:hypothetical protein CCMSSC00406_0007533 [Pleurotus cornucopiae]
MLSQRASTAVAVALVSNVVSGAASPSLPPQSVFINPLSFAVLGQNATFRDSAFGPSFNPTFYAPAVLPDIQQRIPQHSWLRSFADSSTWNSRPWGQTRTQDIPSVFLERHQRKQIHHHPLLSRKKPRPQLSTTNTLKISLPSS